jgi:hypothetical protein
MGCVRFGQLAENPHYTHWDELWLITVGWRAAEKLFACKSKTSAAEAAYFLRRLRHD